MMKFTAPIRTLLLSLLVISLVACGGQSVDEPTNQHENQNQEQNQEEEEEEEEENQNQDEYDPAVIPAHLLLDFSPTRFAYAVDTRITPSATVYNYNWEVLNNAEVEWTVGPEEMVEKDDGRDRWFVRQEGTVDFQACAIEDGVVTDLCAQRSVIVSDGAPTITLESPSPGEHFDGSDVDSITVEGVVSGFKTIDRVQVNGEDIEVDADNRFSTELTPHFGINTVFVRAFDGVNPLDGLTAASFLWAPHFLETTKGDHEKPIETTLDDAIILKLGQNFFDDGNPPTVISESHLLTEDLADIIFLVLRFLDISSQLDNPVVDSSGFVLSVPDVTVYDPRVEIDTTDEGLQLYAQLPNIIAQTEGMIEVSDQTLDLGGEISAALSIFVQIDVEKPSAQEPFTVEMTHFELAIEDATPNFASAEANAIFQLADSALRTSLEDLLLDSVNLSFIDTLPNLLEDVFTSLEDAIAHQEFDLDVGIGEPISLEFAGQIGQLGTVFMEGLEGFVEASLMVDGASHFPDNPGVAMLYAGPPGFPFFDGSRIQIGLNLTLINAIFHNLWDAGLLNIDISEMIPSNFAALLSEGNAFGRLPPLASPPMNDEPFDLMLHVGQLELELGWNDRTDRFGAHIAVGVDLNIAGDSIAIEVSDQPIIDLWLIETTGDAPLLDAAGLETVIRSQLWPEIEEAIGDGLSFGLPIPDIGGLDEFAPELADLDLDVRMTRPMDIRDGFLMLDASFEGELFLP